MWALSAAAATSLRFSHGATMRVTATNQTGTSTDVPISGGSVTADAKSQVRRTGSVSVADHSLWPADGFAALSPVGSELFVEYGIVIPGVDQPEWVPLLKGPIQKVSRSRPATAPMGLDAADRSKTVAGDRMVYPVQTLPNATCVSEITRLIQQSIPGVTVLDQTGSTQVAPILDIDKERWQDGIEKLATAMGAEVYCDPIGRFIIRYQPTVDDAVVWTVDAGSTGVLITVDEELTRENVYNGVLAEGQRTDGTPTVSALVTDNDPDSPTRWGGPFGKRVRYYSSPLLTTTGLCQTAGAALLSRVRGYAATVKVEAIPNPALEPGDVIAVVMPDGSTQRHILDQVPVPCSVTDSQTLGTRSLDIPAEG